jgi:hypothetical protein
VVGGRADQGFLSQPHAELVRQLRVLQEKERERVNGQACRAANPHPRLAEAAIYRMIVSELKEALRARGALASGSKAVLIERLLAAEEAQVVDDEGAEEEDVEEDTDEVLMRQCTCNGAYESDEVVRCIQCKGLFHILCEGLGIDDTYNEDIVQQFICSRCNAAAAALPPDDEERYQLHIYSIRP